MFCLLPILLLLKEKGEEANAKIKVFKICSPILKLNSLQLFVLFRYAVTPFASRTDIKLSFVLLSLFFLLACYVSPIYLALYHFPYLVVCLWLSFSRSLLCTFYLILNCPSYKERIRLFCRSSSIVVFF